MTVISGETDRQRRTDTDTDRQTETEIALRQTEHEKGKREKKTSWQQMKHERRILTYSRLSKVNFSKRWLLGRVDLRICTYFTPPRSEATEKGEGRGAVSYTHLTLPTRR